MGYPTGFDTDLDSMSADEKSDSEGKSETSTHSSNNTPHSTDSSNTLEVHRQSQVLIRTFAGTHILTQILISAFLTLWNRTGVTVLMVSLIYCNKSDIEPNT